MNTVDGALQNSARGAMAGTLNFFVSSAVIIYVIPVFAPFALLMAWLYVRIALPYIQASRDLRRLESISLSPAFAGFDELLMGLPHIRAFAMEGRYQDAFYEKVDRYLTCVSVEMFFHLLIPRFQTFDHVYVC
jgi:ABC transporter transmembrane region